MFTVGTRSKVAKSLRPSCRHACTTYSLSSRVSNSARCLTSFIATMPRSKLSSFASRLVGRLDLRRNDAFWSQTIPSISTKHRKAGSRQGRLARILFSLFHNYMLQNASFLVCEAPHRRFRCASSPIESMPKRNRLAALQIQKRSKTLTANSLNQTGDPQRR